MTGSASKMLIFMEGANNRYVIPVYQRKYDWKYDNCKQLYDDLIKIVEEKHESHFFGSIVSEVVPDGSKIQYHIIDGQQRLTTVSLLLLAISNLVAEGKLTSNLGKLDEQIKDRFLISPWASDDDKIKLRPVRSDREALNRLFGCKEDYDLSSNLTLNYQFFCEMLLKEEIPVDDLFEAIGKLEIISITLNPCDNAQLIFESLNSTGLALTEGDKIRNYVLMGLPAKDQTRCYDTYWSKIEQCTQGDVSGFVRDYLSIKQQVIPTVNDVYRAFKRYAENMRLPIDTLLDDLLKYARLFEKLLTCRSGLNNQKLNDCLYRMKRLEIVVTRPFLMEVLRLNQDGKLNVEDVLKIFLITENYLFRRNICDVPANSLNKIFLTINKDILRYDNTSDNYVDKFVYTLLSKKDSGRFPDDAEFSEKLSTKEVYQMRGKYKAYLFERFENYGTIETKDVYNHLDNSTYTIEHIMPQHLTPAWTEALGTNAAEIHSVWLHRLANLTLTGYNPNLSNKDFAEKRDAKEGGYKASGLKMNQRIATKEKWGLSELEERNKEMTELAMEIWTYPETDFKPAEKEFDSCTLDDESVDLTGRDIVKYSYQNTEQPVSSWTDMFEHIVTFLHKKDKSVLTSLAYSVSGVSELSVYVSNNPDNLRSAMTIDENIYIEKNTSTAMKISILHRLFALFKADPMDLVFYLKDVEVKKGSDDRRRYWEFALPIVKKQNIGTGLFLGHNPADSNTQSGTFGLSGFSICCIANKDCARASFHIGGGDVATNKIIFDKLYSHKSEIEQKLGGSLTWERADNCKMSWLYYQLNNVSILNEADWKRMADFHAEWSNKLFGAVTPYLLDDETLRSIELAGFYREWALSKEEINVDIKKCSRSYTRFTTPTMSSILPDIANCPSGWNTDNHYFYEIVNKDVRRVYIQLAISSRNTTYEFREICDRINRFYPAKMSKEDWLWRLPFRTSSIEIGSELSKEKIFESLDSLLAEIQNFEAELSKKLDNFTIIEFCDKWYPFFENYDGRVFENDFGDECNKLGFKMDGGQSFDKAFPNSKALSGDPDSLSEIINDVEDVSLLGSLVFSEWRFLTHWNNGPYDIEKISEWFRIAINRIYELVK